MSIPLFLIPILAGLVAQALKPVFSREQRNHQSRTLDPRPRYGGMPSAHAAFASALALVAALTEGINSAVFAVALGILILVLDDALRLRVFLGRYGQALRYLLRRAPVDGKRRLPPIEPRMGHSVPEVLGGVVVGALVTLGVFSLEALARGG